MIVSRVVGSPVTSLGVLLIDQIVERSQHEVQQRHIAANRGGE
jgi:hypothetical protein